ncbi:hypothetical protein L0F63_006593 [Massospora cicadina]|nr:hypothetical protein L0F63_006593 [Massospora cicadina]
MASNPINDAISRKEPAEDIKPTKLSTRLKRLLPSTSRFQPIDLPKVSERTLNDSEELSGSSNDDCWVDLPSASRATTQNESNLVPPPENTSQRDSPTRETAGASNASINEETGELKLEDLKWLPTPSKTSETSQPRAPPAVSLALDRYNEEGETLEEANNVEDEELSKVSTQSSLRSRGSNPMAELQMDPVQKKRNIDFHINFPSLPLDDILIDDWHCALQKDILITGRLYVTQERICFHSNLFGWVNHTVIPFSDIVSLHKRSTAFVIPNAIQIITLDQKYFFTSLLSRDSAYNLLYELWFRKCPNRATDPIKLNPQLAEAKAEPGGESASAGAGVNTLCACLKASSHPGTISIDTVYPMSLESYFGLVFGPDTSFLVTFLSNGSHDIVVGNWQGDTRSISYIKLLHNSLGPKQTRCMITQKVVHQDFEDFCIVEDRTTNPDVPSGDAFTVVSRYCMMRRCTTQCRLVTSTAVEWSKSSWFKGPIESGVKEGTTKAAHELDAAVRKYLDSHPELVTVAVGSEPLKGGSSTAKEDSVSEAKARGFKLWPPSFRVAMGFGLVVLVAFYAANWLRVGYLQARISQYRAKAATPRPVSPHHVAHLRELQANLRALGGQLEEIESRLSKLRQGSSQ